MTRPTRDLPRYMGFWLAGGCVAFLAMVAAAALMTYGMNSLEASRQRAEDGRRAEPRAPTDLMRVQEVALKHIAPNPNQAKVELAQLVRDIRTQEAGDPDGFVKKLIKERPEMQGMPFQMGGMCRMDPQTSNLFAEAVGTTHDALQTEEQSRLRSAESVDVFLSRWGGQDTAIGIAALTQIYGPQTVNRRESLAKHLKEVDHPASTKALARAAVFDFNSDVRLAAVSGLKGRAKRDYTDALLTGLHHPWATAAQNAARAIAQLNRQDLVPQLVAFLSERDPREPFEKDVDGKSCTVVREMVKVNHHRNCLLCHSPAPVNTMPGGVFAVVPTPGESFPVPMPGSPYGSMPSEAMVRADVTYLRQDFSVLQPVAGAAPWPEMQRFDFFVRTRVLTEQELQEHQKRKASVELSPHQKAAIATLERLTGKHDVEPTAAAWADATRLAAR
jgi:hypothetical protein